MCCASRSTSALQLRLQLLLSACLLQWSAYLLTCRQQLQPHCMYVSTACMYVMSRHYCRYRNAWWNYMTPSCTTYLSQHIQASWLAHLDMHCMAGSPKYDCQWLTVTFKHQLILLDNKWWYLLSASSVCHSQLWKRSGSQIVLEKQMPIVLLWFVAGLLLLR